MAFTVADYVLKRLSEQHVDTLFGVPAAYCAPLFDAANAHGMRSVVTASELEAGSAARSPSSMAVRLPRTSPTFISSTSCSPAH